MHLVVGPLRGADEIKARAVGRDILVQATLGSVPWSDYFLKICLFLFESAFLIRAEHLLIGSLRSSDKTL